MPQLKNRFSGGSPMSTIKMDNNWELLLHLRKSKTIAQLDSLGIEYTLSQIKLLKHWNLVRETKKDAYKTSIPILDSINTKGLRKYSKQLSSELTNDIKPKVLELKSHLKESNRENNVYTILFSYVIDGMIWGRMEKEKLVDSREISIDNPFWGGEFWTLYPKRDFYCGTNSISENGYSIKVNWSEKAIPKMAPFVSQWELQGRILEDFTNKGKLEDKEALSVFGKYNFFDSDGNFTVPVIEENDQNKIYSISKEIVSLIIVFLKSKIDLEVLKNTYDFQDTSQALIILYHEMIWDIMGVLEAENIIEKPIAFKNPKQARPQDISDLIILVKKGD